MVEILIGAESHVIRRHGGAADTLGAAAGAAGAPGSVSGVATVVDKVKEHLCLSLLFGGDVGSGCRDSAADAGSGTSGGTPGSSGG